MFLYLFSNASVFKYSHSAKQLILVIICISISFSCYAADNMMRRESPEGAISNARLDELMSGDWTVRGFDLHREHFFVSGFITLEDSQYQYEPINEVQQQGFGITHIEPFILNNPKGSLDCVPVADDSIFQNDMAGKLSEENKLAQCIFESNSLKSNSHLVYINTEKSMGIHFGQ